VIVGPVAVVVSRVHALRAGRFQELCDAMGLLGIAAEEQDWLFRVCAAVLHIGNLKFVEDPSTTDASLIEGAGALGKGQPDIDRSAPCVACAARTLNAAGCAQPEHDGRPSSEHCRAAPEAPLHRAGAGAPARRALRAHGEADVLGALCGSRKLSATSTKQRRFCMCRWTSWRGA
jgi:hypothetical protein